MKRIVVPVVGLVVLATAAYGAYRLLQRAEPAAGTTPIGAVEQGRGAAAADQAHAVAAMQERVSEALAGVEAADTMTAVQMTDQMNAALDAVGLDDVENDGGPRRRQALVRNENQP